MPTRATRSGKPSSTSSTYNYYVVPAPDPSFSVEPLLQAAFEREDTADIAGGPTTTPKRPASEVLNEDCPALKRHEGLRTPSTTDAAPANDSASNASARTMRNKERGKAHKKAGKNKDFKQHGQPPRTKAVEEHVPRSAATILPRAVNLTALPACSSGYEAKLTKGAAPKARSLAEVKAAGIKVHKWDGITPFVFTNPSDGKILVVGAGRPRDVDEAHLTDREKFEAAHKRAFQAILQAGYAAFFTEEELHHKRGDEFGAKNVGILMGQGPTEPYNLRNGAHEPMLERLLNNEDIQRLAAFQSASFNLYCPKIYESYHSLRVDVEQHDKTKRLKWNFDRSVFSAAAFNFGPQTVTIQHTCGKWTVAARGKIRGHSWS